METDEALEIKFFSMNKAFNKYKAVLICVFLAVSTLVVYWRVLYSDFVNLDDPMYVTENQFVNTGLSLENIEWAFSVGKVAYWHPLTWLSHILDCQLFGLRPGLHHLTSVVIHIINSVLLFAVLKQMTGAVWRSGFVAAIFALHPINVDSVAWVAERKSVLSTLFWLATMLAYTGYAQRGGLFRYSVTLILFTMGLLAKPMLVTLPFVMLLMDWWPLGRFSGRKSKKGSKTQTTSDWKTIGLRLVWEKMPFFVLSAVSSYLSYLSVRRLGITISTKFVPIGLRIANALVSYISYIGQIVWPRKLAVFYPYPEKIPLWESTGALVALILATIVLLWSLRKRPYLSVGWLWFVGTLIPVIGLVQAGLWPALADRWAYVPMIGLAVAVVWGLGDIVAKLRLQKAAMLFAGVYVLTLPVCTYLQTGLWQNSFTLFGRALSVTNDNYIAHLNFGNALIKDNKIDEAMQHYRTAIELRSEYADAHYNLGVAFSLKGKGKEAIEEYHTAIRLKDDHWKARFRLADALARAEQLDEAIAHYDKVIRLQPGNVEVYNNFALALVKKGRIDEAIEYYNKALAIKPDSTEILNNFGNALVEKKEFYQAVVCFKKALSLKPEFAETYYNLANALKQTGQFSEAAIHYREALRLNPGDVDTHYSLALVLVELKEYDEAITHFEKAALLAPDFAQPYYQLGIIFISRNEIDKAIERFRQVLRIHPNDAQMHCNLGTLLVRQEKINEAIEEFRTALKLDPRFTKASEQLEAALAKKDTSKPQ